MIFVILGMHKSGTTMLAQILQHSGIDMGVEQVGAEYDDGEQYERLSTRKMNMRILGCDQRTFSLKVYQSPPKETVRSELLNEVKALLLELSTKAKGDWGFKDPRTCLIWDVWKTYLPTCRLIAIWRDPREVLRHYVAPRPWYKQTPARLHRAYKALRAWYKHNECIIEAIRERDDAILFDYSRFMTEDKSIKEFAALLKKELTDQRKPGMYRNKSSQSLLFDVAAFLCKLKGMDILSLQRSLAQLSA